MCASSCATTPSSSARSIKRNPSPAPPVFETVISNPVAPPPALGALRYGGSRLAACGDPSQPLELHTALWETMDGGRFFVLYHGGAPRKQLYDLNRDSIIELEMWDSDADGKFEARRAARFAIPSFLMPLPKPLADSLGVPGALAVDTMPLDSAWLRNFHDVTAGPLRFDTTRTPRRPAPAQPGQLARPAPTTPGRAPVPERVDSAALQIFRTSEAGPLRFQRALQGDTVRPPARGQPQPQPRRERPRLLGVPYNPGGNNNR